MSKALQKFDKTRRAARSLAAIEFTSSIESGLFFTIRLALSRSISDLTINIASLGSY